MLTFTGFSASSTKSFFQTVLAIVAAGLISTQPAFAQSSGPSYSGAEVAATTSEATAPAPNVSKATAEAAKRRAKEERERPVPFDKQFSAKVTSGMLVIDGLVAKVQLNYDIHRAGYMYFFVPGEGIVVVSRVKMPDAIEVKDAIQGSTVAFNIGGHSLELTSNASLEGGLLEAHDVYVWLDKETILLSRTPEFGYGNTRLAPYAWPLSKAERKDNSVHFVVPPPMPANLLPKTKAMLVAVSEAKP
jgi:hypothetical protein